MARVLLITYDSLLLATRAAALQSAGHTVRSVVTLPAAMRECAAGHDDVLLLGNRIPKADKVRLIECFRTYNPGGRVAAFVRAGEHRLARVDCYIYPGNPDDLVRGIAELVAPPRKPALKRRAAKQRGK